MFLVGSCGKRSHLIGMKLDGRAQEAVGRRKDPELLSLHIRKEGTDEKRGI